MVSCLLTSILQKLRVNISFFRARGKRLTCATSFESSWACEPPSGYLHHSNSSKLELGPHETVLLWERPWSSCVTSLTDSLLYSFSPWTADNQGKTLLFCTVGHQNCMPNERDRANLFRIRQAWEMPSSISAKTNAFAICHEESICLHSLRCQGN